MQGDGPIVIKLGGSHAGARSLGAWLDVLAACGGHIVVVPGGGPFADAVRAAQGKMGFDDTAAHHMALLAMEQFGRALTSLRPALQLADSVTAIRRILRAKGVPVWSPTAMVLRAADIPASWDVTSDSLAAWLAGHIGAKRLLLIKRGKIPATPTLAANLVARGIVDRAFSQFLAASGASAAIVASQASATAATAIRSNRMPGARIDLHQREARSLLSPPWQSSRRHAGDGP
jgi:dihydroneopterin aldolase